MVIGSLPLGAEFYTPRLIRAIQNVEGEYGHQVSIKDKNKTLTKWGERNSAGTGVESLLTDVGSETGETFVTSNAITTVVSTSASDTQNVTVLEGHTLSGTDASFYNFGISGDAAFALNGTTPVTIPTALFRASRARLSSPAVGTIKFYSGTLADDTTHLVVPAGEIQSQKASTTISSVDYYLITSANGSVLEKTNSWCKFRIEIKPITAANFYPITEWAGGSDSSGPVDIVENGDSDPIYIVPPNHDVRIATVSNAANVDISGGMTGHLAIRDE